MRVIIAGGRDVKSRALIETAIKASGFEITELVTGMANGVDAIGEMWARAHNIPVKQFFPDWGKYGRAAETVRNEAMAAYADALIAIPAGDPATHDMIRAAGRHMLSLYVHPTVTP